ncbi:hypothetical protein BMF94_6151 [Rhodotorula taiwanensis]|uniref:J domain-containing protein n=1 Tax=Rhodotorula taiwanensis TaxID=741276 RepID=A0A2S5B228_9BASI|nr:hypothetical protein BMF94_6151 [Rhodotorula taiwanensis]
MRVLRLLAGAAVFALAAAPALAWTNEDHEIFDIVSALESAEGKGTTFYSFLNTTKQADDKAIAKAYRKRSLELHPDKNPNDKKIQDRFARLGVIANILKDAEKRKRYDHFYDNGVPKWRGTGYYYSRYRPGLGAVLAGLTVFSCFVHYIFLYLTFRVAKLRIGQFRIQALEAAWGPTKKPLAGRKRLKVKTAEQGDPLGMPGVNDGRPIAAGATIEMVVEGEKVYIVENRKENLLTEDLAVKPSVKDTWLPKLVMERLGYLPASKTKAKRAKRAVTSTTDDSASSSGGEGEASATGSGTATPTRAAKVKGPGKGVEGQGKIGGRRRKTVPARPASSGKDAK